MTLISLKNYWPSIRKMAARIATPIDFTQSGYVREVEIASASATRRFKLEALRFTQDAPTQLWFWFTQQRRRLRRNVPQSVSSHDSMLVDVSSCAARNVILLANWHKSFDPAVLGWTKTMA